MRTPFTLGSCVGESSGGWLKGVVLAVCSLMLLSACQSSPPTREQRVQIREAVGAFQRSVNTHSYETLRPYLAPEVQVGGLPPEMSLAGLKGGMYWTRFRIGETQVLSVRNKPDGPEARVALYAKGRVMTLKMGFDTAGKIRSIDADPLWKAPRPTMPASFTSDFVVAGKLMFVRGTVNGMTGYFLFDTGASVLLLNAKYFKPVAEAGQPPGIMGSVSGLHRRLGRAEVSSLQWGGLRMSDVAGEVYDFSQLERPGVEPLLGAISYNEVKDCAVDIDWQRKRIQVFATNADGTKKVQVAGPAPDISFTFTMFSYLPLIKAGIGGREYSLLLDTGAESNVLPDQLALSDHFRPQGLVSISDGRGVGGKAGLGGVVDEVTLGGAGFRDMPFVIYRVPYLSNKGFLGAPLFQRGRVEINFPARQLSIWR